MFNILSILIGIVGLILVLPFSLPFLGWGNWFVIPVGVVGLAVGLLSRGTAGRNLNLLVLIVAVVRLSLGGGFF